MHTKLLALGMRYILGVIIYFIYLFPVYLTALPSFISTRTLYTLLLFCWILICLIKHPMKLNYVSYVISIQKQWKEYWKGMFLFFFITVTSVCINSYLDTSFFFYPASIMLILLSTLGMLLLLHFIHVPLSMDKLFSLQVGACVLQCFLSILLYALPTFYDGWYSLIRMSELEEYATTQSFGTRLTGVGTGFFGAGVTCSMGLFCCTYLLSKSNDRVAILTYILSWIFILVVGSGLARTTQVGAAISLCYLFVSVGLWKTKIKRNVTFIIHVFMVIVITGVVVIVYLIHTIPEIESLSLHTFEAIYNLFEEGRLYTDSSNVLLRSWPLPDNVRTWIIGDAKFMDPTGQDYYYMGCDIGWYRLLYCVGVAGLISYCYLQYLFFKIPNWGKFERFFVFIMFLTFLHKGFLDLVVYVAPIALVPIFLKRYEKI